jgi:hypothetical protein
LTPTISNPDSTLAYAIGAQDDWKYHYVLVGLIRYPHFSK